MEIRIQNKWLLEVLRGLLSQGLRRQERQQVIPGSFAGAPADGADEKG